jgi:hypothetical protein
MWGPCGLGLNSGSARGRNGAIEAREGEALAMTSLILGNCWFGAA